MNVQNPLWHNLFRRNKSREQQIADLWMLTPIFDGLSRRRCLSLAREMHLRTFKAGEKVFSQGEVSVGIALVLSGQVKISSGQQTLAEACKGDFFGEIALVMDETRTADALALEDTELVFFLRPNLHELVEEKPREGAKVLKNVAQVLAKRLKKTNDLLALREQQS